MDAAAHKCRDEKNGLMPHTKNVAVKSRWTNL